MYLMGQMETDASGFWEVMQLKPKAYALELNARSGESLPM